MVGIKMSFVKHQFESSGLRSEMVEWEEEEGGATRIHCWVPRPPQAERGVWSVSAPEKPALLLLHEFVAGGTLNWEKQIRSFHKHFHVYVPDLLFFGASTSSRQDRTEIFQAECMVKMLHALEVYNEVSVVGCGYGGLVAFWMAHLHPKLVEKVVFVDAGTHMDSKSQKALLGQFDYDHISELLLPTTVKGLRNLASVATHKRIHNRLPEFISRNVLDVFFENQREEKVELLNNMVCGSRQAPPLPHLTQEKMLVMWGENDQITSLDLAHKLVVHLGNATELVVMEKCGHFPHIENPQKFNRILHDFLTDANSRPLERTQSQR